MSIYFFMWLVLAVLTQVLLYKLLKNGKHVYGGMAMVAVFLCGAAVGYHLTSSKCYRHDGCLAVTIGEGGLHFTKLSTLEKYPGLFPKGSE